MAEVQDRVPHELNAELENLLTATEPIGNDSTIQNCTEMDSKFVSMTFEKFIAGAKECTLQDLFKGSDMLTGCLEKYALDLGKWLAHCIVRNPMAVFVDGIGGVPIVNSPLSEAAELQVPCAHSSVKLAQGVFTRFLEFAGDLVKSDLFLRSLIKNQTGKDNSDLVRTLIELKPICRRKKNRDELWNEMRKQVFGAIGERLLSAHFMGQMKAHGVGFCSTLAELEAWRISYDKTPGENGRFPVIPKIIFTKRLQLVPAGVRLYLSSIWDKKNGEDDYSAIYRKPVDFDEIVDLMNKEIAVGCSKIGCPLAAYKEKVNYFDQTTDPKPQDVQDLAVACVNAYCCHGTALEGQLLILNSLLASKDDLCSPILDAIKISDKGEMIKSTNEYLGSGRYGSVHKFKDMQGQEHCLKFQKLDENSSSAVSRNQHEKDILKSLSGVPNIIQLVEKEGFEVKATEYHHYLDKNQVFYELDVKDFLITTPVGKPLNYYLTPFLPDKRKEQLKVIVERDIRSVLTSIHGMNIVHRDVRTPNIIIMEDEEGNPKDAFLIDFGLAKIVSNEKKKEFQFDLKYLDHVLKCIHEKRAHLRRAVSSTEIQDAGT